MDTQNLYYDSQFWQEKLGPDVQSLDLMHRLHLAFSLLLYLDIALLAFFEFTFSSTVRAVRHHAGRFMAYFKTGVDEERRFPPAIIFRAWHANFPKSRTHLHDMTPHYMKAAINHHSYGAGFGLEHYLVMAALCDTRILSTPDWYSRDYGAQGASLAL
ncbi:hypothetical protein BKA70DRAFT_1220757 [Coprinopsis sp. MPI-PUGE-AT-0042]|nr:hypothetical protein BKA70DRAFT_1220757 [Coprinopsis sp. MPI-PUGE-AT-0042]